MADGISLNSSLNALANELLNSDNDKIITVEELESFVKSKDEEIMTLNIDAATAFDELEKILDANMKEDDNKNSNEGIAEGYNRLKAEVEALEKELEQYKAQKEELEEKQKKLSSDLEKQNSKYEKTSEETNTQNEKYANIVDQINAATEDMQDEIKYQQRHAALEAVNTYNPEKDGDWNSFLENFVSSATSDSSYKSIISNLISESDFAELKLDSLNGQLASQGKVVTNLDSELSATVNSIKSLDSLIENTTVKLNEAQTELQNYILNLVGKEEMDFVTNNNIDLKEALPNGNPRYILAPGKEDGKLHIYDMGNDGASLARQFGQDGQLKGINVVSKGNGYIRNFKELGSCAEGGTEYYWLGCCGMNSSKACYCTQSPLEFDLEGDGHNLDTSKTVKFDIDGDGKLDNINNTKEAVLVFDADGDGVYGENGKEVFGNNTDLSRFGINKKFNNGFEALNALADVAKKQGIIDKDSNLDEKELAKMEEAFGMKIKLNGYNSEAKSLKDAGITSINLSNSKVSDKKQLDKFGNEIQTQQGATFTANGETHSYADVWHRKYDSETNSTPNLSSNYSSKSKSENKKTDSNLNLFISKNYSDSVSRNIEDSTSKLINSSTNAQNAKINYKNAIKDIENMSNINIFSQQMKETPEIEVEIEETKEESENEEIIEDKKELKEKK